VGWGRRSSKLQTSACSRTRVAFIFGAVFCFAAIAAKADVIYSYTGNDFTTIEGNPPQTTSEFLTLSLTFDSALPPDNPFGKTITQTLLSWTISDQLFTYNQNNATISLAAFATDANGNITSWGALDDPFSTQGAYETIWTWCVNGSCFDSSTDNYYANEIGEVSNFNNPGIWTTTQSSAEPSTSAMGAIGAAVLLVAIRRRRRLCEQCPIKSTRVVECEGMTSRIDTDVMTDVW
jgi:hypothetical protein